MGPVVQPLPEGMINKEMCAKWLGGLIEERGRLNKGLGFFREAIRDGVPHFEPPHAVYEFVRGEPAAEGGEDSDKDEAAQACLSFRMFLLTLSFRIALLHGRGAVGVAIFSKCCDTADDFSQLPALF